MVKDCTAPGGPADPDQEKVWKAYRERKAAAIARGDMPSLFASPGDRAGDSSKGAFQKGKGRGKGKGKGKGKGGRGAAGNVRAAVDDAISAGLRRSAGSCQVLLK